MTDERIERVYQKVYRDFIESMDGVDNGVNAVEGGKQNYESRTSLSHRVGRLNPYWNETVDIMVRGRTAYFSLSFGLTYFARLHRSASSARSRSRAKSLCRSSAPSASAGSRRARSSSAPWTSATTRRRRAAASLSSRSTAPGRCATTFVTVRG